MFYTVLTILFMFALFMVWKQVVTPWWTGVQNQWHYGDNPVTIYDADVGHGGVSHFIAEYYKGTIVIVELPAAAFTKYQVYVLSGYYGAGNPIILLSTAPGQTPGKPNLVVSIQGTGYGRTLYNTGISFSEQAP